MPLIIPLSILVQSDQLKGQIAALSHQTSELQRRETDSRAEINILTTAMAAAQHQYQQEMKDAQAKHQVCQIVM